MGNGATIKLKICGMRDPINIMEVAAAHPDYMGFIFYPQSPRYVGEDFEIPAAMSSSIKRVGVFVNEDTSRIMAMVEKHRLGYIQLHGEEPATQCAELRRQGINVIKVFSIGGAMDFESTKIYEGVSDYFLFDTKGKYYGGNAKTFNWKILDKYDQSVPFFLSGGLMPSNLSGVGALTGMNLHAVDVNSGVESSPAYKNIDKVKEVIKVIHQC